MTQPAIIQNLIRQMETKKSLLCVGLDTDITKIPKHLLETGDPIFEFNKAIIDATHPYTIAYKPNIAFYEAHGVKGWQSLEKTIRYLNENHPEIFTIADAKRGDIGNTSTMYAKAFFDDLDFDSITVSPYMGSDSVEPFLAFDNKCTIVLALTSNGGAFDFQTKQCGDEELYKTVLKTATSWQNAQNLMFVVGATKAEYLKEIREIVPNHFLLVPGVGAQGGSLEEVCRYGLTSDYGLLINASRAIIYASAEKDFAEMAKQKAKELQQEMAKWICK
ncbi:MAG: orotidine-5'-phosphate decarboxylase [Capnocytophaga sp.]|nr:orotidine-5'-phosphate decarboxylase [Capnocytophaga sp.]